MKKQCKLWDHHHSMPQTNQSVVEFFLFASLHHLSFPPKESDTVHFHQKFASHCLRPDTDGQRKFLIGLTYHLLCSFKFLMNYQLPIFVSVPKPPSGLLSSLWFSIFGLRPCHPCFLRAQPSHEEEHHERADEPP